MEKIGPSIGPSIGSSIEARSESAQQFQIQSSIVASLIREEVEFETAAKCVDPIRVSPTESDKLIKSLLKSSRS